jgi:hypothetical protein
MFLLDNVIDLDIDTGLLIQSWDWVLDLVNPKV